MAAFTPTGVKAGADAVSSNVAATATMTAGQAVTGKGKTVDPQSSDEAELNIVGLLLQDAVSGGRAVFIPNGSKLTVTNVLTYPRQIIAARSGQLQYDDDLVSGDEYIIVGYTTDANTILVQCSRPGVSAP